MLGFGSREDAGSATPGLGDVDQRPMREFVKDPYPERICWMGFGGEDTSNYPLLSIGVQQITHNIRGLKVLPHFNVMIATGDQKDFQKTRCDVDAKTARALARRLNEFADAADKLNGTQKLGTQESQDSRDTKSPTDGTHG